MEAIATVNYPLYAGPHAVPRQPGMRTEHVPALEIALTPVDLRVDGNVDLGVTSPHPCSQPPTPFYTYRVREGLSFCHVSSVPGPMGPSAVTPGHKASTDK